MHTCFSTWCKNLEKHVFPRVRDKRNNNKTNTDMKKLILLILAFVAIATGSRASVVLNSTNFPDAAFRVIVSNLTGVSVGGTISDSQLASVTSIDVSNKKIMC